MYKSHTSKRSKVKFNINFESLLFLPEELHVYRKDLESVYQECNDSCAILVQLASRQACVGLTDHDYKISKREAMSFQQQDKEVITSGIPKYFVETVTIGNNQKVISILKSPLKNQEGKTIGVFGISYCTAEYDLKKSLPTLVEANLPIKKYHPGITGRKSINFGLSNKQTDCLYWLTKGMTIKQIAKNMNLSPRTVESYLETVKIKLSCNSRMELVEQALKIPAIREQLSR